MFIHQIYKAKSLDHEIMVTQNNIYFEIKRGSYWIIIPKYDVHTTNSLQDVSQNHWAIKYRSLWPTIILRSNVGSYWIKIPKYDVHTSNSLQDIRQNHWTVKYKSCWPTFILRSNIGSYWLIIPIITVTYIYYEVKRWVILNHNPKVWCS